MKAITIEGFGSDLHLTELPTPTPLAHEVQIQVEYAGVNPVDWKICEGYLKNWLHHDFPIIPGWDVAGTVTAVGDGVDSLKVGDEVFSYCRKPVVRWGTYAEYVCVEQRHVALKPANISFAEAASVPLAALTAWQSLFDFCNLQKGQTILVHAGAGGVGSFAVQFAKNREAIILATASRPNHSYLKDLGVDVPIDYHQESFVKVVQQRYPQGLDAVYDCVGGQTLKDSLEIIKAGGCLASIVDPIKEDFGKTHDVKTGFVFVQPNGEQLAAIGDLIASGKVKIPHLQEFPLGSARQALELSHQGHVQGKIVLKVR